MKTKTKEHILDFIRVSRQARPIELVQSLGISPQAIHRHLKSLVVDGMIESREKPPTTYYVLADIPHFDGALNWFQSKSDPGPFSEVCETRDVLSARLSHFVPLQKRGLSQNDLPLVISMAGELGNNSFDHNLGQWHDVPGCWFEFQITRQRLWILIADRGQGIYGSLSKVFPDITNEQTAIEKAFKETISGRFPEQRGNGLKFVTGIILKKANRGIACVSGKGKIQYGNLGNNCAEVLKTVSNKKVGTITLIAWGME